MRRLRFVASGLLAFLWFGLVVFSGNAQSSVVYENWGRGLANGTSVRYKTDPALFEDYGWSLYDTTSGCVTRCPTLFGSTTATGGGFMRLLHMGSTVGDVRARYEIELSQPATITVRVKSWYAYSNSGGHLVRIGDSHSNSNMGHTSQGWRETTATLSAGIHYVSLENVQPGSGVLDNTLRWDVDIVEILGIPAPPPPPPPPTPTPPQPSWGTAVCYLTIDSSNNVLTATNTITGAGTITGTSTVTVSANLLLNAGYEVGTVAPDNWRFDQSVYAPNMWQMTLTHGRVLSLLNYPHPAVTTRQDITNLPNAPAYAFGIDAKGAGVVALRAGFIPTGSGGGGGGGGVVTAFDTMSDPAPDPDQFTFTPVITAWQTFSHTTVISGNRYFAATLPPNPGGDLQLQVDNAFLVPVEIDPSTGAVLGVYCPAVGSTYGLTPTLPVPIPPPSYVPPSSGSNAGAMGGQCLLCTAPQFRLDIALIGMWFTYLGCVISNLITCHLFSWIFSLLNTLFWIGGTAISAANALIGGLGTFLGWLGASAQGAISWGLNGFYVMRNVAGLALDWIGEAFSNFIAGLSAFIAWLVPRLTQAFANLAPSNIWTLFTTLAEFLWQVVNFITMPILSFINILIAIVTVMWDLLWAVGDAILSDPESINEWAAGAEIENQAIVNLLWGMATVDATLAEAGMVQAVYMIAGAMGLMAFKKWSKEWETIAPI